MLVMVMARWATIASVLLACGARPGIARPIESKFAQVAPVFRDTPPFQRSSGQQRAVIFLPGMRAHLFSSRRVGKAAWYRWQLPGSTLVEALAREADTFAFAYSQTEAVERIAEASRFGDYIRLLKKMGYREVILVGHSAGGVVARHFVEDDPDAGVTRVIQVCTPNEGTVWGKAMFGVRRPQEVFVRSLSKAYRRQCLAERAAKRIPKRVEFVSVIGLVKLPKDLHLSIRIGQVADINGRVHTHKLRRGDGLVSCAAQWPEDLQQQGIPAVLLETMHFGVMQSQAAAERIREFVRERQPRWDASRVAEFKQKLFGNEEQP